MIVDLIFSFLGWVLVAVAFEYGFELIRTTYTLRFPSHKACTIFWIALGVLALGEATLQPHLLTLIAVAAIHIDLSKRSTTRITFQQLFMHIETCVNRILKEISEVMRKY